ncbi:hypothetical protein FKP32DRAFT_1267594 [Trametes sanguinea]|nr:hypothetical protein FKP32DRAFT_1267594 [Trametes sanguinea]
MGRMCLLGCGTTASHASGCVHHSPRPPSVLTSTEVDRRTFVLELLTSCQQPRPSRSASERHALPAVPTCMCIETHSFHTPAGSLRVTCKEKGDLFSSLRGFVHGQSLHGVKLPIADEQNCVRIRKF